MTAEEYRVLPDDGRHTELVLGRIVEMPPTNFMHGIVTSCVNALIRTYVKDRSLGWVTGNDSVIITERDPDSVRGPDVAFFSYTRIPKESPPQGYPEVAPELVFEVRSPSDRWSAINAKASEYLAAGVLVVCVLDPETRTAVVYTENDSPSKKTEDDELTLPEVFPDFKVSVRQFFE
jgi:Uma2 family endonuclease